MRKILLPNKALILVFLAVFACDRSYVPKPEGYLRIYYPEKAYTLFSTEAPFEFEYPVYARLEHINAQNDEQYWYDINFPDLNGSIHLSYKQIENNLDDYINDSRTLVYKHSVRSDGIQETPFYDTDNKRYGILYELSGNVASPVQFFLTDSIKHFLRGSLYFNTTPNRDSLNPVIVFVTEDIRHMIETLKWK